jgi:hypothetical protein
MEEWTLLGEKLIWMPQKWRRSLLNK